jgi:xanthine/CO dehydrogenase XdhC/CoxF family maturation factor
MSNRLASLLTTWFEQRDTCEWVLASIVETQRSSYRKAGAMMLINSLGKSYGLLSGGCLEADLMRKAQKCWITNANITVCYDMQDDDDIAWQLGIGCGGLVKVLLQPINIDNNYLHLIELKTQLDNRQHCFYQIDILTSLPCNQVLFSSPAKDNFAVEIKPAPAIVIFGGGLDAQPLVTMAHTLGWYICLIDCRTAYARPAYFKHADQILNLSSSLSSTGIRAGNVTGNISSSSTGNNGYHNISQNLLLPKANAVVVMHHNVSLDAHALSLITQQKNLACAQYIGLLGPQHRTDKVFQETNLTSSDLPIKLANPIGLDLGGELPESIALSILSQAHAAIEQADAKSLGFYQTKHESQPSVGVANAS